MPATPEPITAIFSGEVMLALSRGMKTRLKK
jgi:hypothetical protein